jgi:hypothetical protein
MARVRAAATSSDAPSSGSAARAFALFARQGGDYGAASWILAPRQPSAAIFERLRAGSRRPTDAERRRAREALAIKMQPEVAEF